MTRIQRVLFVCLTLVVCSQTALAQTVTFGAVANASGSTATATAPSGISDGCLLIAPVASSTSGGGSITAPAGFRATVTEFTGSGSSELVIFTKTAASESGNYTFTGQSIFAVNVIAVCWPGGASVDVAGTGQGGTGTTATALSVTSTVANDLIFYVGGSDGAPGTVGIPTGYTSTGSQNTTASFEGLASGYVA